MTAAAQRYYEWTDSLTPEENDGKALFGRDAMANYMIVGAKQLGYEIFTVKDGRAEVNLPRDAAKKLWDNYYIPYIKGYFASSGRFRSDDMKTGNVIAFVGSSAGATFFPDRVTTEDENSYPIEIKTLPAPQFEGGEKIAVQQGAGMVILKKSDAEVEASVRFLKWFTQSDWSIEFCVGSSYMPVTGEYNDIARIERSSPSMKPAVRMTLETSVQTVKDNAMYTSKAFVGGMTARKALEYSMSDLAKTDRESVKGAMAQGASLEEACAPMMTEEYFDAWYTQLMAELTAIVEE
ncbi:MAG: extracellular solute-binding protein [Christensenellales bacterium]